MSEDTTGVTPDTAASTSRTTNRLRLIAFVALLSGGVALASAFAPWFHSTSRLAQEHIATAADSVCSEAGGIVVQSAQGTQECAVWDTYVTGRGLANQSAYSATADGITRGIAYQQLPSSVASLPAPTFWAILAALLVVMACAAHSIIASALAPMSVLMAWSALNNFAAYATNPAHGGSFVEQSWGTTATKLSIAVVSVMSVSGGLLVFKERRALWHERQSRGLPATEIAVVIRGAITRTLAEAAKHTQQTN